MTFAKRLYLLLLIAVAGLLALTVFVNGAIEQVYNSTSIINTNVIQSVRIIDQIRDDFLNTRIKIRSHTMNTDPSKLAEIENKLGHARRGVSQYIDLYLSPDGCLGTPCIYDSTDAANIREIKRLWTEYDHQLEAELSQSQLGPIQREKVDAMITANIPLAERLETAINDTFNYNMAIARRLSLQADQVKRYAVDLSLVIAALTIVIVTGAGLLIIRYVLNMLGGEPALALQVAQKMATGDLASDIPLKPGDSSSMMAAIKTLSTSLNQVSRQADAISAGDLGREVAVLSEHDKLGKAINHMVQSLRNARSAEDQRNWLNEGHKQLTHVLTGDFSRQEIAEAAIAALGSYLGAGRGVIYVWQNAQKVLELCGTYMTTDDSTLHRSFRLGEGVIGRSGQERKPVILHTVTEESQPVVAGTGQFVPSHIYAYPLLHEGQLIGVMELAAFRPFDDTEFAMMTHASDIIAMALYIGDQRGKINQLLAISEQAEQDARVQNQRLQEVNSQMEEQQQQLQQQSEELQQSNAQLEEQQQQLQQQSEELRQANSQMVEQQKLLEINNEELRQSKAFIDDKAKQLEQSNYYKSEFLANMSHELRTPLNAIILLSKMMSDNRDGTLIEADVKKSEVINRSGKDLLRLINDVLDLSKVDAGRMDLNIEQVSTSALLGNLQDLFGSLAQNGAVQFILRDQIQGTFNTDPDKLNQVLRNLLSNAFKFTKAGSVTLSIEMDPAQSLPIKIKVRDTGIGIPKDKLGTIFEAFRQVDGSISREYGGTGLGLTISQRFVELLGGAITIQSEPGQGSEFTVSLPATSPLDQAVKPDSTTMLAVKSPEPKPELEPKRKPAPVLADAIKDDRDLASPGDQVILLIDDDVEFCRAVVEINHRLGYKTVVAHSGAESIRLAVKYRPAGILLDLGLPDRDGVDLLHDFKSSTELATIPVYIISARDRDQMTAHHNIVGYIQKPVSQDQIAEAESILLRTMNKQGRNGILIISGVGESNADLLPLIESRFGGQHHTVRQVFADNGGVDAVATDQQWAAAIIDMAALTVDEALTAAGTIRDANPDIALLFYGADHLQDDEEAKLRAYTDSIIANAATAEQRLLDNTERFLRELQQEQVAELDPPLQRGKRLVGKMVLVIDDDIRNLFVLTAALEQEGAHVLNASNGRRALDLLEFERVDIIITDIMMPEMDGYQTITAIRANPKISSIPIIALSAKAMPEDRRNIIETGADDYLSKPVDYEVLSNMTALWCSKKH